MDKIVKNINFGVSKGVNKTVQEAQAASKGAIRGKFTIRNNWLDRSPIAIKAKFSNKNQAVISGEVSTTARFLPLQDAGGTKLPYKNYLAIPIIPTARPSKGAPIPKANLPRNLKNAFILTTESGRKWLCVRKNKGRRSMSSLPQSGGRQTSGLVVMYQLVKKASIKRADIFEDPIKKVVDRRLKGNIDAGVTEAFRTMR